MKLRVWIPILGAILGVALTTRPAMAQAVPNSMGVIFHNISFEVPDYDAEVAFWTKFGLEQRPMNGNMNGNTNGNARLAVFHCPNSDVSITVHENKDTSGGSEETVINHIGFQVPDVPPAAAKWKTAGIRVEPGRTDQQVFVYTPDNVRIEILQDPMMTTPIKPHHIHWYVTDTQAAQAYYAKMFGGVPGKRGQFDADDVPNMNLTFTKSDMPLKSTNGRLLHHIGFGVPNVETFKKELEAKGVVFDPALQPAPANGPAQFAYFLDPWGTLVQLFRTDPIPATSGR